MTSTTAPRTRVDARRRSLSLSILCFASSALFLLTFHVYADASHNTTAKSSYSSPSSSSSTTSSSPITFWERLRQGPDALVAMDKILFAALILLAFEILDYITKHAGQWLGCSLIPVRGKHLDELTAKDILFIGISKAQTAPFVYLYLRYAYFEPRIQWTWSDVTISNTLLPLIPLFVIYDLFYTILHWFLHVKAVYGYIHKHHHVQKAPSRANVDAVNVHPIEFFLGEYNHLLALFFTCRLVCRVHVLGSFLFLVMGGILAGMNHTRYDVVVQVPLLLGLSQQEGGFVLRLYDSKAHDVHHRIPQSNYGQYIMLWDVIFGSYRPYNPKDRINPDAQLDPITGKSVAYMTEKRRASKKLN